MEPSKRIKCGKCGKDVQVVNFNKVRAHTQGPGYGSCSLGGADYRAAILGLRVMPKQ